MLYAAYSHQIKRTIKQQHTSMCDGPYKFEGQTAGLFALINQCQLNYFILLCKCIIDDIIIVVILCLCSK